MGMTTLTTVVTALFAVFAGLSANNYILRKERSYRFCKAGAAAAFLVLGFVCFRETESPLWMNLLPGYVLLAAADLLLACSGEIRPAPKEAGKKKPSKYSKHKKQEELEEPVLMPPLRQPWFGTGLAVFAAGHLFLFWQVIRMGEILFTGEGGLMAVLGTVFLLLSDVFRACSYFRKKVWWMIGMPMLLLYYSGLYLLTAFVLYL